MKQKFHYATVTDAVSELKKQGYTLEFGLQANQLIANDLYRYEGASDPADEATVYALASKSGVKGTLVTGYGASFDDASTETLKQLHYKYNKENQAG
jgi:hypothetical protein